ncbi:maleylpyruvate isomerase N-terminal domain-containing protein [Streptomyces sp. NPDC002911]
MEAFRSQRRRFVETVSAFGPAAWRAQSRCTEWSVHDVVRHVRDVAAIHVARLDGSRPPFPVRGPFHPATTPAEWLASSAGSLRRRRCASDRPRPGGGAATGGEGRS